MSLKNFYQTLYQNDQLFRLDNDPFGAIVAVSVVLPEPLLVDHEPAEAAFLLPITTEIDIPAEAVTILESVDSEDRTEPVALIIPAELEREQPIVLQPAPAKIIPSVYVSDPHTGTIPPRPQLNHKVLILVDEELLPSDLLFLEKVLNAINLNVSGVDLLNVHGLAGMDFAPILADKVIHHFLTFGVPFERINLDILMDRYQPVRFHGITFMLADSLAAIEGDKLLKKRLWEALKRIFLMG